MPSLLDVASYWWDKDMGMMKMTTCIVIGCLIVIIFMLLGLYLIIWSMPSLCGCGHIHDT